MSILVLLFQLFNISHNVSRSRCVIRSCLQLFQDLNALDAYIGKCGYRRGSLYLLSYCYFDVPVRLPSILLDHKCVFRNNAAFKFFGDFINLVCVVLLTQMFQIFHGIANVFRSNQEVTRSRLHATSSFFIYVIYKMLFP